ncbi:MAG: ADP-ribosylglycohydrolase family protein [Methanomicrobiales archaeon]|nr:ADP-ribosylglycohydrolase family protein [Methanomicrobiales archaeon]MDD1671130.1 ADP-ribosylglycohydrolase family protein [Methanomicrobiales archaeon]
MLLRYTGCLLGAAIGDAMGMPGEGIPADLWRAECTYRRAHRGHPNDALAPGQFTDDTQLMLISAGLLSERAFSLERYAERLAARYRAGDLRFPDGSVAAACLHLEGGMTPEKSGVNSTTAGCIPAGIPFALTCQDPVEIRETVARVTSVTHTNPAAIAGSTGIALLIHHTLAGSPDDLDLAWGEVSREDPLLGEKIRHALYLEKEGIGLDHAIRLIGNDLSVYQTIPLAFFLMARYSNAAELLSLVGHTGGNTATVGLICGAYLGAKYGKNVLPSQLVEGLEDHAKIETLAGRLLEVSADIPQIK